MIGISLFSGAGGLDLGATKAGLKVRQCVEFDPDSCETLRINHQFSDVEILQKDIREVDFTAQKEKLPPKGVDKRIVIGGPPCQPFSKNSSGSEMRIEMWIRTQKQFMSSYAALMKLRQMLSF